jgi:hypothetical protein
MSKTTTKTYQGQYAAHTFDKFTADATRALPEGWLPVRLEWADDNVLDVVFERSTPVEDGEDRWHQSDRPSFWSTWDDLPERWHLILTGTMQIIGVGMLGLMVALVVTTVLR